MAERNRRGRNYSWRGQGPWRQVTSPELHHGYSFTAGRNVPGTRRKVALHDESFDGTQQNSLVRICLVMMRDVWLSMMQSLYRGFTAWNTLEWPQSLRKPWEIYGPTLFTAKKRHLIEKSEEPWRHEVILILILMLHAKTWIWVIFNVFVHHEYCLMMNGRSTSDMGI